MNEIKNFIIDYLEREYDLPAEADIDNFDFIESGYVDSLGFIQFIYILEDEYNIEFSDEELSDASYHVVGKLSALVESKIAENS